MTQVEDSQRIIKAITERVPNMAACSVCRTRNFTLGEGLVRLDLSELHSSTIRIGGGPSLPSVVLVCQNCGNTILLNLIVLGLQDLLEPAGPSTAVPATSPISADGPQRIASETASAEDQAK